MTRKCSHCSHNGHNSRTCPNRGVKLFGVRLTDGSIRKSASMGNLTHYIYMNGRTGTPQNGVARDSLAETHDHASGAADGYASEDFVAGSSSSRERKKDTASAFDYRDMERKLKRVKGVPWTEEEHRMFLLGLQKLGKGDWRGIARNYVLSRTPTQVASHAQKYFVRQCNASRRKRRASLFDIVADESVDTPVVSKDTTGVPPQAETQSSTYLPPPAADEECESMEYANSNDGEATLPTPVGSQYSYPVVYPAYVTPYFPMSFPFLPGYCVEAVKEETHEVLKPTAVHSKSLINVGDLIGISRLSLGESLGDARKSTLSLKLVEGSTRPSAFHASGSSCMNSSHSPIHAV